MPAHPKSVKFYVAVNVPEECKQFGGKILKFLASCTLTCFATPTCIVGCIGGKLKDDGAGDAAIDCVCKVIPDKYAKYC